MSKISVALLTFALVLLTVTAAATASEVTHPLHWRGDPKQGIEYALASSVSLNAPFTIQTRFLYAGGRSEPAIWVAGLASEADGIPDALVFKWVQDTTGWFPVWKLRLETRLDLLPSGLIDRRTGDLAIIELADVRPQAGREYQAALSYDPADATLSLILEDAAAGSVVYAAHLQLAINAAQDLGNLYPGAGWNEEGSPSERHGDEAPAKLLAFTVSESHERHGLPLALKRSFRSTLLEVSQETGALRRKLGHDFLKGEAVGLRLEWPAVPFAGEVRATLVVDAEERLLVSAPWQAETQDITFDPDNFPLGESLLILEHVHGTHRSEIARWPLQVVEAKLQASYKIRGLDFDRDLIVGEFTLAPDLGVAQDAELIIEGTYAAQEAGGPWEPFVVLRHRFETLDGVVTFPLEIPTSPRSGLVRLEASVKPGHVAIAGGGHQFSASGINTAPADSDLFPFVVNPWQESPDNLTNIAHWLERPAGKSGFVTIKEGRFVAGDGSPIRFLGVNCAFSGCFPDHATAERVARQLARFGVNLVRFHHMDMQESPGGIWRRGAFPRQLDPNQLDRLDYFIYQLKENGIYSNLNLHVSRTMSPQEGFPEPEKRPDFDKGLSLFDPGIIAHQKAYARDLLTHRNPYTGNRYVDEPAIAMVEITNENGLIYIARQGLIDTLPQRYQEELDSQWQHWLTERYGTTEELKAAWGGADLSSATEIAGNGRFDRGLDHWALETDADTHATMRVVPLEGPLLPAPFAESVSQSTPLPALQVSVVRKGSLAWRPQVYHTGLDVQPGKVYLISFWLKASRPHVITSNLIMHHEPWTGFASFQPAVTTEWQRFEFVARVPDYADVREGRVSFNNLEAGGVYWIADLSVKEVQGGGEGLPPGEDLTTKVSRPEWHTLGLRSSKVQQDYIEFLWDVEQAYFDEMYRFIKDELGARAPVSGTQVPWSPSGIQAHLDYIDAHAYWNHPEFPGAAWDASNWQVRNNSMIVNAEGGTVASLARNRVAEKPFVVSEYNHPAPITFGSEAFLLKGAYGAFQDWDGLIAFAWSHDANFWPQRITNFFDIKSHPTKLVTLPAVAALLLRGDVRPGEQVVNGSLPADAQRRRLIGMGSVSGEIPPLVALQHRVALVVDDERAGEVDGVHGPNFDHVLSPGPVVTTDTGELRWERSGIDRAVVTIDTKRSKGIIGYGGGRAFDLSGVTLTPGPTRQQGWSAITLTVMEGEDFAGPGRILLTATGYVENVGMGWERLGGDAVTVRNRWGEAPTLVEGVPAQIELPVPAGRLVAYALDGAGYRRERVPVRASEHDPERAVIDIGPQFRTLWYEIEVVGPSRP